MTDKSTNTNVRGNECCEACNDKLAGCFDVFKGLVGLRKKEIKLQKSTESPKDSATKIRSSNSTINKSVEGKKNTSVDREVPEGKEFVAHPNCGDNMATVAAEFDLNSWLNMNRAEVNILPLYFVFALP